MHRAHAVLTCLMLSVGALRAQEAPAVTGRRFEAGLSVLVSSGQVSPGLSLAVPVRHGERLRVDVELTGHRGPRPTPSACAGACPAPEPDQAFALGTAGVRVERALPARVIAVADAAVLFGRWATDPAVSAVTPAASVGLGRESKTGRFAADLRLQWLDTPTAAGTGLRLSVRHRW